MGRIWDEVLTDILKRKKEELNLYWKMVKSLQDLIEKTHDEIKNIEEKSKGKAGQTIAGGVARNSQLKLWRICF